MRRAKIVCTIGPATRETAKLKKLIEGGMDVARLNFSHGTHDEHRQVYERIRSLSDKVAVMQDLQGPKIRLGEIAKGEVFLRAGDSFTLTSRNVPGDEGLVHVTYSKIAEDVRPGDNIFLADGIVNLEVERVEGEDVNCRVVHGGVLTPRKGVNLPGIKISAPALTDKDREDLAFGLELGVDMVALSFVRTAREVNGIRSLVMESGSPACIVAKVEKREALETIDEIVEASDALMIARGDLGVEIPTEEVPVMQKSIISKCRERGKPVITATQMLESMVASERPTRAEASDVANAVLDGTDAVMLSAETATGQHPVDSVCMMDRIVRKVEEFEYGSPAAYRRGPQGGERFHVADKEGTDTLADAVCAGAVKVADEIGASAIACLTHKGKTARMIARYRPRVPILALTDFNPVVRHMSLVWGVRAIQVARIESTEKIFAVVKEKVREAGYRGSIVFTAGIPTRERGPTNTVHVVDI